MKRRGRPVLWTAILVCSVLFHLKGITAPPFDYHYHRQTNTAAIARNYYRDGLHFFSPQIDWEGPGRGRAATEFPLYMWLVGVFWGVFGLGDVWGRVLSTAFSAATAIYLFEYLRDELGETKLLEAFAAALVFCCLPLEIYFGRTIQPEALALFAMIASLYHWNRALGKGRSPAHWSAAVLFAFLAVEHKLPYAYFLGVLAVLAHIKLGKKAWTDARVLSAPVVALGLVFAWYKYASAGTYVVPTHEGDFLKLFDYGNLPHYVFFQFTSRFPELSATYAGLALGSVGALELVRRRGKVFFAWWFACVCVYIVACGAYAHYHEYTSLPYAPINAAFIGVGAVSLAKKAPVWAALLVLAIPIHAVFRINHWYKTSYPFLTSAARAAAKVSGPDDLYVVNERASALYLYFLDRRGWGWGWEEHADSSEARLQETIREGARFFATRDSEAPRYVSSRYSPPVYDDGRFEIFRLTESTASRP